ncbi:MAG TPA: dinitrogenase iron-molybdenum cofactor [Synergistaceae bacterium]|jgi:predicted Fe-Mo cluster-binding NifX family protein|nr:MAG: Dinitrogenase iron-molybdenum cofactor biosynthesis protein [Synergistales bacterium 54_9]HAA48025.1 dinitrogenase iron-molybdenum cofactor [Synergistaceae bacterium]HAG23189.1 dinitrogenase iron-molybdenum cofactor [Synergistaceae bacterium]
MKIAVAAQEGNVCPHFGHAPTYAVFTVDEEGNILDQADLPNPGHAPGVLPQWLGNLGVDVIIAGGMGPRAEDLFRGQGIEPVIGATGNVKEVVAAYFRGILEKGPSACHHEYHEKGHQCSHNDHNGKTQ